MNIRSKVVKTALNPQKGGFLQSFTHSLQPYTGCAFGQQTPSGQGCPFCYVRKLPVALFAHEQWGEWVEAKMNIASVLRAELLKHQTKGTLRGLRIFMSSATDPYQGIESRLRLTRSCLEAMVEYPPELLVVQTRSPLVVKDVDLLKELGSHVWVSLTIETNDDTIRRLYTPTTPTVKSRLDAMRSLRDAGIRVQAAVSPMLPNEPKTFSRLLENVCDRVLVDTLFHGDGANGRRSESLGMQEQFSLQGHVNWYHREAHQPLLQELLCRFGSERVVFSKQGFNDFPSVHGNT